MDRPIKNEAVATWLRKVEILLAKGKSSVPPVPPIDQPEARLSVALSAWWSDIQTWQRDLLAEAEALTSSMPKAVPTRVPASFERRLRLLLEEGEEQLAAAATGPELNVTVLEYLRSYVSDERRAANQADNDAKARIARRQGAT